MYSSVSAFFIQHNVCDISVFLSDSVTDGFLLLSSISLCISMRCLFIFILTGFWVVSSY